MAMGIVSDDDFEREIKNSRKIIDVNEPKRIEGEIVDKTPRGRGEGNVEVPESLRTIIADEALVSGRASALKLASSFGIKPSSVSAYTNGANSTASYDTPNEGLNNHLKAKKERIANRARNKLNMALSNLTNDKFESAKARDIAAVAKDMSIIIKNMEPPTPLIQNDNGPKFVLYAPQFIQESKLEVIEVQD
jgi:hypothetical protein